MKELGFELCSKEELLAYYMEGLQRECDKRNLTIEEYMIDYLLTNHGREFWRHLDDLIFSQMVEDSGFDWDGDEIDDNWDDDGWEADALLDEYEALQKYSNAAAI